MSRRKPQGETGGTKWLTTFNDLVTLMLTFFVLVLSLSHLTEGRVREAFYSVSEAFGMLSPGKRVDVKVFTPFVRPIGLQQAPLGRKQQRLLEKLSGIDSVDVRAGGQYVTVTLQEKLFFKTGGAAIEEDNLEGLSSLSAVIKSTPYSICVEGHTDDVPIGTAAFPSNWHLSLARAVAIVKYFIAEGVAPERLSAAGYADTRPLLPNTNDANRKRNRRVEVIMTVQDKE